MTKCDFCEDSIVKDGKVSCFWTTGGPRETCNKAIKRMVEALKGETVIKTLLMIFLIISLIGCELSIWESCLRIAIIANISLVILTILILLFIGTYWWLILIIWVLILIFSDTCNPN